jgi:hypothetical protein
MLVEDGFSFCQFRPSLVLCVRRFDLGSYAFVPWKLVLPVARLKYEIDFCFTFNASISTFSLHLRQNTLDESDESAFR